MSKIKKKLIIVNLILLFFFSNYLYATSNFYIVTKVDNEIITNIDIVKEVNYLIALNNDLKKIDKKSLVSLARDSLIKEKVKMNEINKYYGSNIEVKEDVLKSIIQNYKCDVVIKCVKMYVWRIIFTIGQQYMSVQRNARSES